MICIEVDVCRVLPERPAIVPVVGPPIWWAKADGDLENLCVHDMSHHAKKT